MVQLTRIYTRGGDKGKTSLGSGQRVAKHDLRVDAYGSVDEANAILGIVRLHTGDSGDSSLREMDAVLSRVQNDLFDLGADLCTPEIENPEYPPLRVTAPQVDALEGFIDVYNEKLEPLNSFILPGGSPAAAYLHQARTVTRRAERLVSALSDRDEINQQALRYLNRLSDLLFVLSRAANENGRKDVLWVPGKNR
ncbi:cob(I)yrinic acid a,c-diamide adenosyltransferase [Kiloniella sp. b19]|uniref:cob(I)yrinic acid a,c-diamide adenosyltransferase n=1 Tax=Kiloniella sp. GXU_MW_B19 TaxID=3141326 RepID=UPI0031DA8FDF